eukprot:1146815-Pelagomonas_calceolata.AAC.2
MQMKQPLCSTTDLPNGRLLVMCKQMLQASLLKGNGMKNGFLVVIVYEGLLKTAFVGFACRFAVSWWFVQCYCELVSCIKTAVGAIRYGANLCLQNSFAMIWVQKTESLIGVCWSNTE